jgi:UDP-N-acetylmuramyl tripeptide synthase
VTPAAAPFDDSRRLTGCNLYFDVPGAVLEAVPEAASPGVVEAWRACVARARASLDWPDVVIAVRPHAHGVTLALTAPLDQLFTATEVNEWALWHALLEAGIAHWLQPHAPGFPAAWDEGSALHTLRACACAEREGALTALAREAERHGLDILIDDDDVTLGSGRGGRTWPRAGLPLPQQVPWNELSGIPIALVTGSNGKTTVSRLLAALARAHGWRTAHSSTDGVFIGTEPVAQGDYSGPAGARLALRLPDIDAAVLETARGGILRRGLAPTRADVAVVTNISDDHFGEYGIDDLDGLAQVKLTVARVLDADGTLVVNGDDALLLRHAERLPTRRALFALDADAPSLRALRAQGGATCGVRKGRLLLEHGGEVHDLGDVGAMPLAFGGVATYNVANLAAAALAGHALGIGADLLRTVFASFGSARGDNPGRLEHFVFGGIEAFVDYAHNPDGLRGLLEVATRNRRGPLMLLLGQAGNRGDAEIRALAAVAVRFGPDYIVLKDLAGYLRGREEGGVPVILRAALVESGIPAGHVETELDEFAGVLRLLAAAQPGATLVLPVHVKANRSRVGPLLDRFATEGWRAGTPLPGWVFETTLAATPSG